MSNLLSSIARPFAAAKETLHRFESGNPHTAGQVRVAVGGVLLADGLVGLENPLDGKKTRPGLFGALPGILFAGMFVGAGLFVSADSADTDATTSGAVISVGQPTESSANNSGGTCSLTAQFEVDGATYTAYSAVSSSGNCDRAVGESVKVDYNSANPAENSIGMKSSTFGLLFVGAGLLIGCVALVTFLTRLAAIVFGIVLLFSGRRMMSENPKTTEDQGIVAEAREAITNLLQGRAADARGPLGGLLGHLGHLTRQTPADQSAAHPVAPPVAPAPPAIAPGWYATADGNWQRYHDGTGWTEQVRQTTSDGAR